MSEWREVSLDSVAIINPTESLKKGQVAKKISMDILKPFTKKPPTFLVEEFNGGMKFRNGDTIVARITPCLENGKTAYIDILDDDEVGFGSTEYIVIRECEGISDKHFLYYFSVSPIFRDVAILSMTGSSGRQRVQTDVVKQHIFEIPELSEQKAIAAVLSSLDDKIDLLHRQNKTLEAISEMLFKQWFVVEAREDWEEKPLKEVVDIGIGRTPPRQQHQWFSTTSTDIKWISIKDLGNDGAYIFKTSEYLTQAAVEQFNIPVIPENTVVLSFKMTIGRVAITTSEILSNEAIAHFKFNKKTPFTQEYLYLFLKRFKYDLLGSTSSIVTSINSAMIKDMDIAIPDDVAMKIFEETTKPVTVQTPCSKTKKNIDIKII